MSLESELKKRRKKRLEEEGKSDNDIAPVFSTVPIPKAEYTAMKQAYAQELEEKKAKEREERANNKNNTYDGSLGPYKSMPIDTTQPYIGTPSKEAAKMAQDSLNQRKAEAAAEREKNAKWFQGGALSDGLSVSNVVKTILGTGMDVANNVTERGAEFLEHVVDAGAYVVGGVGGIFGAKDFQDDVSEWIAQDNIKGEAIGEFVTENLTPAGLVASKLLGVDADKDSLLGDKADNLVQSGAHMVGTVALQAAGVPAWLTMGLDAFGGEVESAYQNGATHLEAGISGAVTAGAEIIFEKISSGIKIFKGNSLDDTAVDWISRKISNKLVRTLTKWGMDVVGEGGEEVLTEAASALGRKLTYMDEEEWKDVVSREDFWDAFVSGAVMGGVSSGGKAVYGKATGKDSVTGLRESEDTVVRKVYEQRLAEAEAKEGKLSPLKKNKLWEDTIEDMDKGYIPIDEIEEALGGESYTEYKNSVDAEDSIMKEMEALRDEYIELNKLKRGEMTGEQVDRQNEIREKLVELKTKYEETQANSQKDALKSKLSEDVFGIAKGSRLENSYIERANRGKVFEADLSQYDEKTRATVQKAIDSGILNNTNRTHEFVDAIARISASSGRSIDFANTAKLKEMGYTVDGATVNGVATKDGIIMNIDSPKAWQSTIGHEITHYLEGTEHYAELQKAIFEYAKTKGDFDGRLTKLTELYKNVEGADINAELTADLVGDYLFQDNDFIMNLSTKNRNVFQKIYDELKRLLKIVTPKTKEARQLDEVKRAFDKAYKALGTAEGKTSADTKYSVSEENSDNSIDKYSQKQYNDFGWARDTEAITKNELDDMYSKIHEKGSLKKFPQTSSGETIIEVNDNPHTTLGVDNVFAFVTGTKNNPQISKVVRFQAETDTEMEIIKEKLYERGSFSNSYYSYLKQYGLATEYRRESALDYIGYKEKVRGRSGGAESNRANRNIGIEQNRSGTPKQTQSNEIAPINEVSSKDDAFFDAKKTKYSLSDSEADNAYADAVKNRDWDTAQKLVDDAAKKAGYTRAVYHGTESRFTVFDTDEESTTRPQHAWMADYPDGTIFLAEDYDVAAQYGNRVMEMFLDTNNIKVFEKPDMYAHRAMDDLYGYEVYNYPVIAVKGKDMTIYATLDNTLVKSSLAATYDDNGNLIPLSKRFNHDNPDIRYSLSEDSEGRKLTDNQLKYFEGSKVVDDGGNLKAVYHGSPSDFNEFSLKYLGTNGTNEGYGFYFTDSKRIAEGYSKGREGQQNGETGRLFEVYLDIKKPLSDTEVTMSRAQFKKLLTALNNRVDADGEKLYILSNYGDVEWEGLNKVLNYAMEIEYDGSDSDVNMIHSLINGCGNMKAVFEELRKVTGYDGIIVNEASWGGDQTIYIAFHPEQIKNVDNLNPTENPDIRKSLTAEGDTPKKYGNRYTPAKELRYEGESIAPTRGNELGEVETADVTENTTPTQNAVQSEFEGVPEGFAPMTEADADAIRNESFNALNDADAPDEVDAPYYGDNARESVALGKTTADKISREVANTMGLDAADRAKMKELIEKYAQNENLTEKELFDEIKRNFLYTEEIQNEDLDDTLIQARRHMRGTKVYVNPDKKADFVGMGYNSFNDFKKAHFGHFYITTQKSAGALSVDGLYKELSGLYPGLFPAEVDNVADELKIMGEVADNAKATETREGPYDDDTINEVVGIINKGISEYSERETLNYLDTARENYLESVGADDIAPVAPVIEKKATENAAPSFDTSRKNETDGQQTMFREPEVKAEEPIKTVKDRLQHKLNHAYGELSHNKRLRREAIESYNEKIANLMLEYDSKKNKDTKLANSILRRIENLTRLRDDVDTDYTKRINDLRAKVESAKTKLEEGYSDEEGRMMRSELHAQKVDEIKNAFSEKGLDFDATLKNAKDLNTFRTVDNTPQRVMEKSLGYKGGQVLADLTVNKVAQNETEGIKWLNSVTSRQGEGGLLKQLSKRYNIKPGSKESAAAQMYAEGFYVDENSKIIKYGDAELAKDFPNAETQKNIKGLARDPRIRQFYDDTLTKINESRTRNAYPEIKPLDNYFLHFRAMDDTFSRMGIPFNPNDIKAKDLPTDLNGVTADLKPGQPYFASAMHRRGIKTTYDLLGGMERYATGAKNQIYHIDDIQTLRALRNYIADTYGQANGLDNLDNLSEEEVQDRIKQVYNSHLSTFAKFLNEEANVIAGKTALIDRGLEGIIGRRGIQFLDTINKQVGSNMVGMNVSSAGTNFLPVVQAFAKTNKTAFVKGFAQTVGNRVGRMFGKADSFADNPTAIRRKGADRFARTPWQKTADAGYALMSAVDNISTEVIVRAKYNEYIKKGMSEQQAITEADKWASRLMGDRSLGQMPQLYNSKFIGLFTKFQLEVRNQLDSQFYDTVQETKASNEDIDNALKRNAKTAAKVTATFVELAVAQHIFGKVFESIAGYNPAFDIIEAIIKALGFDDDEESEDTALDNLWQGFLSLAGDMPYSSLVTDGGRIPISSALPIGQFIKGEDKYGNEKSRLETLGEVAPYYLLPTGYGQIKKTAQGLSMFSDEHPIAGSYTDSGNLRFPVDDTLGNRIQAGIFGQWASKNARDYFDNERAPLKEKQIEEFDDVGMTIQEYWKYREGLAKYDTLAEKAEYINSLDLSIRQKNILINNIANREDDIDMSDFDDYDSFEEFDFAMKYSEKYDFFKENGISYEDYANADEDGKRAYTWAAENPGKYKLSKAVTDDFLTYYQYRSEMNDFDAKDENGETVSGLKKERVIEYINNLDLDYGQKIILYRSMYDSKEDRNTYNMDIVNYLNERQDISYEEMETILKELGFTVDSDGNIYWD